MCLPCLSPCVLMDLSFDLAMPLCCDDEYLTGKSGQELSQQPSGEPSLMAYFNLSLKLSQIEGLAIRTIVSAQVDCELEQI